MIPQDMWHKGAAEVSDNAGRDDFDAEVRHATRLA
jgi:hypothetical protein